MKKLPFKGVSSWSIYLNYFLENFFDAVIPAAAAAIAATVSAITGNLSPVLGESVDAGAFFAA